MKPFKEYFELKIFGRNEIMELLYFDNLEQIKKYFELNKIETSPLIIGENLNIFDRSNYDRSSCFIKRIADYRSPLKTMLDLIETGETNDGHN